MRSGKSVRSIRQEYLPSSMDCFIFFCRLEFGHKSHLTYLPLSLDPCCCPSAKPRQTINLVKIWPRFNLWLNGKTKTRMRTKRTSPAA